MILRRLFLIVLLCCISQKNWSQKFIEGYKVSHFQLPIETNTYDIAQDSFGFVWIATLNGLWRYNGGNFKNYIKNPQNKTGITDNHISCIYEDYQGTLWIGTYGGGLLRYDRDFDSFERFTHDPKNPKSLSFNEVRTIYETTDHQLYIGTDGGGLNLLDRKTNTFKRYTFSKTDGTSISHNNVLSIREKPNGNLFVGTWIGLNIFNPKTEKFTRIFHEPLEQSQSHGSIEIFNKKLLSSSKNHSQLTNTNKLATFESDMGGFTFLKKENDNNCWFTAGKYVSICDSSFHLKHRIDLNSLFHNETSFQANTIFHDQKSKNTWILDRYGSFFLFERKATNFKNFLGTKPNTTVKETLNYYWVLEGNVMHLFSKTTHKLFKTFPIPGTTINFNNAIDNTIWVVNRHHIFNYSETGKLLKTEKKDLFPFSLLHTKKNELWIGEVLGISAFYPKTGDFTHYECEAENPNGIGYFHSARKVFEDHLGNLWFGTFGDGLKKYDTNLDRFINYRHHLDDNTSISNNFINDIYEDQNYNLWIGTKAGLCKLDPASNSFTQLNNPILQDNVIKSILEDIEGNLWIGTPNGLIQFNPTKNTARILYEQDGLISNKFTNASIKLSSNKLLFSTAKGPMLFDPKDIKPNNKKPQLYISKLWVNNELVAPNSSYILKNIEVEKTVTLDYSDKKFELEFQVINFNNNQRSKYKYKLKGYDKSWIEAHNSQKATYTNIPSGAYTFLVKASNESGIWNEEPTALQIHIQPPFWEFLWVKILIGIICIGFLFLIYGWTVRKERNKLKFEIEKERVLQFEEVAKMKLKFFTNISHELRTPLTLITSPLEKFAKENTKPSDKILEMMYRNSSRLLVLINQILDFRKLETTKKLQISPQTNLSVFDTINAAAEYWNKEKNIQYSYEIPKENYTFFFDSDVVEKIVTNLVSNAFKYTSKGGIIKLTVSFTDIHLNEKNEVIQGYLEINVIDNGIGIPKELQQKVFERFYQLDENPEFGYSSGIGLSLTSELVQQHKGNITLHSEKQKGSHFKVILPIGLKEHNLTTKHNDKVPQQDEFQTDKNVILLVEDNLDIRSYIKEELSEKYHILEAENGNQGLKTAIKTIPNLIISDIMMPDTDGIQMANQLKNNELTAHIPLLFLTAKSGDENKITGLQSGAEDYIQKPFNLAELKLKIRNLLESRKLLIEKHRKSPAELLERTLDNNYIQKLNNAIESQIENPEFSVDLICSELGISRSQLYRKTQGLTGKSIIEYTNSYRLSLAMNLIKKGTFTMKEIAYKVGYNDSRYFSRIFKKEYGNPPSHFRPKKGNT